MMVSLQSSVNAAKTITLSALRTLDTYLMLISEHYYSARTTANHHTLIHTCISYIGLSLYIHQVFGFYGKGSQCDVQKDPSPEFPVLPWFVPSQHLQQVPEREQLPVCPLWYRAQNMEGAERDRWPLMRIIDLKWFGFLFVYIFFYSTLGSQEGVICKYVTFFFNLKVCLCDLQVSHPMKLSKYQQITMKS